MVDLMNAYSELPCSQFFPVHPGQHSLIFLVDFGLRTSRLKMLVISNQYFLRLNDISYRVIGLYRLSKTSYFEFFVVLLHLFCYYFHM